MWKSAQKSPAMTTANSVGFASARSEQTMIQQPIIFPQVITENPQYSKLFQKIYKSQEKAYALFAEEEQKQTINNIKQTITDKLKLKEKENSFYRKFGKGVSYSARKAIKNDYRNLLGITRQQQNDEKLNNFLMNHKNAVELEQQARLAQYHLRDQESARSKIDYLNRIEQTSKHKRTAPNCRERSEKLFRINNQLNYQVMRMTAYIKNDKFMSRAIVNAQHNPTYRRMKNFSQIQYILKQDSQNLMISHEIPKNPFKQKVYNISRRIFISMALASDSLRTYYDYIKQRQFANIVELLLPQNETERVNKKLNSEYILGLINKIIKYKQNKVIHFQDFNQILRTVHQQKDHDIIALIINNFKLNPSKSKYKKIFISQTDEQLEIHKNQIKELLRKNKMEVLVKKIYELNKNKIIGLQYLPLRDIVQFMKGINIVPKIITMSKFMQVCYWHQLRREGFNREQFINIQIALGWELENCLQGIQNYFKLFNIQQIFMH